METKIRKPKGAIPSDFELSIAQEIYGIEMGSSELKADLADLYIFSAKEVEVGAGRRAVLIFVPFRLLSRFRKVQKRLISELEKKMAGKHVIFIGQRTILGKSYNRSTRAKGPRPRSRTLTSVQEAYLDDIVYPSEILGKRTRCRVDGSKTLKVYLDSREIDSVQEKLDTFAQVYKNLTNKDVAFEFPVEA